MRVIAVIAVRMGSERLPGKTLLPICGTPMLGHLLDRVQRATMLQGIVVAAPQSAVNNPIAQYCTARNIPCFRGPEEDVALRMLGALQKKNADIGVQLYGDSPIVDPAIIDTCVQEFTSNTWDWLGNDLRPGFSSGFFVEAFSVKAFADALKHCSDPAVREHGTLCLRREEKKYHIGEMSVPPSLNRPEICLSVDSAQDAILMEMIFGHFAPRNDFTAQEIIAWLDAHPEIRKVNTAVERRWRKYQKKES